MVGGSITLSVIIRHDLWSYLADFIKFNTDKAIKILIFHGHIVKKGVPTHLLYEPCITHTYTLTAVCHSGAHTHRANSTPCYCFKWPSLFSHEKSKSVLVNTTHHNLTKASYQDKRDTICRLNVLSHTVTNSLKRVFC